jgi:hypothetical protein
MLRRIGIFFMMVGGAMALIYWVSTYFPTPDFLFLMIGLLIFVGGFFFVTHTSPASSAGASPFPVIEKKEKGAGRK